VIKGANISECGLYRYRLWRWWDEERPLVNFIMLNPSTADADNDDPTIRKCCGFAKLWRAGDGGEYGGIMVTNLFAYRTSSPKALREARSEGTDIVGPHNNTYVHMEAMASALVIAAWGNHGWIDGRDESVRHMLVSPGLPGLRHIGTLTKQGRPRHPLYIPYDAPLVEWVDR